MMKMKLIPLILVVMATVASAQNVPEPSKSSSPYGAGEFNLDAFYATATDDFNSYRQGGGLGASYWFTRQVGISADAVSWKQGESWFQSVDQASIGFSARLPLGDSGLAPFGTLSAIHSFEDTEWRFGAGAGIELRIGNFGAFGSGQWVHDFTEIGEAQLRAGVRLNF